VDQTAAGEESFGDDFSDADVYYALTDRRYVIGIVSDTGARRERVRYTPSGESKTYAWTTADIDGHLAVGAGILLRHRDGGAGAIRRAPIPPPL
jgi:hypothetical protein